jgi:hypothetical protein
MSYTLIKLYSSLFICHICSYDILMYTYLFYNMSRSPSFVYFNACISLLTLNIFGYYEKAIIFATLMLSYINSHQEIVANKINKLKYIGSPINTNNKLNFYLNYIDNLKNIKGVNRIYTIINSECDSLIRYIINYSKKKYNQMILDNDYIKRELEEFKKIKMEFEKIKNDNIINNEEMNMNIKDNNYNQDFQLDAKEMEMIDQKLDKDLDNLSSLIKTLQNNNKLDVVDLDNINDKDLIDGDADSLDDTLDEKNGNNTNNKVESSDKMDFIKTIDFNKMFNQLMTLKEKKLNVKLE